MYHCNFLISRPFLELIELPVFVKDTKGIYRYCNQAFADCFGIDKNQILGRTAYEIVPRELADIYTARDQEFFKQILIEDKTTQLKSVRPMLSDGIFNKIVVFGGDQTVLGFLCIVNLSKMTATLDTSEELKTLTHREVEVLNQLVRGKSTKAITRCLYISSHTVTDHLKSIYRKLDVHSKNEALYKGLHLLISHPKYQEEIMERAA